MLKVNSCAISSRWGGGGQGKIRTYGKKKSAWLFLRQFKRGKIKRWEGSIGPNRKRAAPAYFGSGRKSTQKKKLNGKKHPGGGERAKKELGKKTVFNIPASGGLREGRRGS